MTARVMRQTIERGAVRPETAVAWVLAKTAGEMSLTNVQALYTAGDADAKWLILKAQQVMRVPGLETQLRQIIQNEANFELRIAALEALAAVKDTGAVTLIEGLLTHPDAGVRAAARFAYEMITGAALPPGG